MTFLRGVYPTIFDNSVAIQQTTSEFDYNINNSTEASKRSGLKGMCWKASRIGERCSPYVGIACVVMALHLLFFK